jgi:hypothetical protein
MGNLKPLLSKELFYTASQKNGIIISNNPAILVVSVVSSCSEFFKNFIHESPLQWRLIAHWAQRRQPLFYFRVRITKAF